MHISAQLIESYPKEYGSGSCAKEKLSIPLEAHDKHSVEQKFSKFSCINFKELYFFFIFRPILLKLFTTLIESFPTKYGSSKCGEEKL